MFLTRRLAGRRRLISIVAVCAGLLVTGTALAATSVFPGSYFGTTSEHGTVALKVVAHGPAITSFKSSLGYDGKCGQGGGPDFNVSVSRIAIGKGGKFSKRTTLKLASNHTVGVVSGKASGSRVTGKIVGYLVNKPNPCYTETFSARLGQ
ncbi:MAG TPA: hypothetical protein VMF57_17195 [Solirubrobacteraceae bacterium]|nr:hypothetical protein [Solirubrobacteraceae bacterium]